MAERGWDGYPRLAGWLVGAILFHGCTTARGKFFATPVLLNCVFLEGGGERKFLTACTGARSKEQGAPGPSDRVPPNWGAGLTAERGALHRTAPPPKKTLVRWTTSHEPIGRRERVHLGSRVAVGLAWLVGLLATPTHSLLTHSLIHSTGTGTGTGTLHSAPYGSPQSQRNHPFRLHIPSPFPSLAGRCIWCFAHLLTSSPLHSLTPSPSHLHTSLSSTLTHSLTHSLFSSSFLSSSTSAFRPLLSFAFISPWEPRIYNFLPYHQRIPTTVQ
jgi:hypothetical protein